jgi:hypothetical protein
MEVLNKVDTTIISTGEIAASANYEAGPYIARGLEGDATIQFTVTGDGALKIELLTSNDGAVFNDIVDDIVTGQTKASGISGTNMVAFGIPPCDQVKIKFTETGGASHIHVAARIRVS